MSTISKPSGMARFLTTLFALVMIFGLSAAVPTPVDDVIESRNNELEARGNTQSGMAGATLTTMGNTDFRALTTAKGSKYGSYGFDSCLGVLIIGNNGAIIGHYAATDNDIRDTRWQMNPKRAAAVIPTLFNSNRASLTPGLKTYVYAQINADGTYVFPQLVADLVNIVQTATGVAPKVKMYKKTTSSRSTNGGGFIVEVKSKAPHGVSWES
ncbi:hypothetical protein B0O99DRAFT_694110 [Bisporella sp. PMI_857]|nr:hypothetical protein B0O99DRAFT_694110 [Bisporella sp. PMI_857]